MDSLKTKPQPSSQTQKTDWWPPGAGGVRWAKWVKRVKRYKLPIIK